MKPYYYVFKSSGHPPSARHESLHSAHVESLRLAALHPGQLFEILKCLGTTQTGTPSTFWMDGVNPYQPTNQSN
jgi:hypothetical protein